MKKKIEAALELIGLLTLGVTILIGILRAENKDYAEFRPGN